MISKYSFLLDDLKLSYIKKNLIINYNNCLVTLDPESNLFSLPFNSEKNLTQNDFKFEKKENVNKEIKSLYTIKKIIEGFNFKGITTNIILNSSHMGFSLKLKNINIYESKDKSSIFLLNDNLCLLLSVIILSFIASVSVTNRQIAMRPHRF